MQPEPNLLPTEVITQDGLIVEKYPRNLTVFRPLNKRRATADLLVEAFQEHDRASYAETGHARSIIDLRTSGWPTAYSISVFVWDSTTNTPKDLIESFAFVMSDGVAVRIMAGMLGQFPSKVKQASRVFFDITPAFAWLHERDQTLTLKKTGKLTAKAN
jgi:hypothetical protein